MSPCQFSFRPHFSTKSALLTTTNLWFSLLNSGSSICAYLQKPFNLVPHKPFLDTFSKYNLPSHIIRWFRSYLPCRYQYIVVDGSASYKHMVTSGVPEGSILGPLLIIYFILYLFLLQSPLLSLLMIFFFPTLFNLSHRCSIDLLSSWLKSRHITTVKPFLTDTSELQTSTI